MQFPQGRKPVGKELQGLLTQGEVELISVERQIACIRLNPIGIEPSLRGERTRHAEHLAAVIHADEATLRRWWQPAQFKTVLANASSGSVPLTEDRFPLDPWLMGAACLVLLAEMFFVHRLCPKASPKVVSTSVVSKRGFFAPADGTDE